MRLLAQVGNEAREIDVEPIAGDDGRWRVVLGGRERIVDARRVAPTTWSLLIDGRSYVIDVEPGKDGDPVAELGGVALPVKLTDPRKVLLSARRGAESTGPLAVRAPIPGKVVKVLVKAGDDVAAGQGLVVIEAMKMENELRAPRAGKVASVAAVDGRTVEAQEVVLTLA